MVRAAIVGLALLLGSMPISVKAMETDTGNGLLELCEAQNGSFESGLCYGFVDGIVKKDALSRWMGSTNTYLCDMPGVTKGQIVQVVVDYLRKNPATRHYAASGLVSRAVQLAFCQK